MHLPKGVVEGHCVNDICVFVKGEQFLTCVSVPDFASAVVASRDELTAIFVKRTVSKRQQVCAQYLKQAEALLLVFHLLFNQFFDEFLELRLAGL